MCHGPLKRCRKTVDTRRLYCERNTVFTVINTVLTTCGDIYYRIHDLNNLNNLNKLSLPWQALFCHGKSISCHGKSISCHGKSISCHGKPFTSCPSPFFVSISISNVLYCTLTPTQCQHLKPSSCSQKSSCTKDFLPIRILKNVFFLSRFY